jgi:hypothetical protein
MWQELFRSPTLSLRRLSDAGAGAGYNVLGHVGRKAREYSPLEATERQALLDAVAEVSGRLTILELGAGVGRWTVYATA